MPPIGGYGVKGKRRKRRSTAPVVPDQGDPARRRPAPPPPRRSTAPPRRAMPAPAFRPIKSQSRPFRVQQTRARVQTRRATRRLPPAPASQRAPARAARPPASAGRAPAFRPINSQARGFRVQQTRANITRRRALARLPDHPAIPDVRGLYLKTHLDDLNSAYKRARLKAANGQTQEAQREYAQAVRKLQGRTPDQLISEIRDAYKKAARSLGGTSISDLYQYGSLRQRRQMHQVGRLVGEIERGEAERAAAARGIPIGRDRVQAKAVQPQIAGIPVGALLHRAASTVDQATRIPGKRDASLADLAAIGPNLIRATAEHPGAVAKSSLRTAVESITGIPEGVKQIATDPGGALAATVKDYERRYGSIFNNPAEFRRRVQKESGLTPFVLDAATLGVPAGRAATMLARTGAAGRAVAALARVADENGKLRPLASFAETAHKAARAPRDARRLANLRSELHLAELEGDTARQASLRRRIRDAEGNVKSTERPALRFSGGEGGVRKQGSSPNLIVALGQRGLDASRRSAHARDVARHGMQEGPGGRLVTTPGRGTTRMTALRPGAGEVVPKTTGVVGRSGRELPGLRRYTGRVARDLGEQQSVTRVKLLTHRGRLLHKVNKTLKPLDEKETSALKYMLQLGATPDHAGVRVLERRRTQIMDARARKQTRIASVLENSNDELQLINRILDDPAGHLTPRARAAADELRGLQLSEARRDPELTPGQEVIRRLTPQGKTLGVTRGPDAAFFRSVLGGIDAKAKVPGVARYADPLADLHPSERAAAAKDLLKPIRRQRKQAERDVETARRRVTAATTRIRELDRQDVRVTTPQVTEARRELARAKRARRAAGRRLTAVERRAGELTGRLSERGARGAPLSTPEVRYARGAVSAADKRANALRRELAAAEEKASRLQGRTEGRYAAGKMTRGAGRHAADQAAAAGELRAELANAERDATRARENLRTVEREAPRLTQNQQLAGLDAEATSAIRAGELGDAEMRVAGAKARLEGEQAAAPRVSDAARARLAVRERELAASRATREHLREFEKTVKKVVRASKSKRNMRLEDADAFAERVRAAADAHGLAEPAYWWSSLAPKEMASLAAAGRGLRAAHANKRYKGSLFDIGAEEHGIEVLSRGMERNVKRRFQQALVVRNLETHAYEWSRGVHGAGLTISELEKAMIDRAIDPKTIELVDPRVLRRRAPEMEGSERGRTMSEQELTDARTRLGRDPTDEDFVSTTQQELAEARRRWSEVEHDDLARQAQHRFLAVPRQVGETLDGLSSHMDNQAWRMAEIVLKQKPARILLGAANIPWLAFQIASNALLTGFGGGVNPWNVWGAHKWWKGLTPDEREAVEAELGITHGHHFGMDQPHLGATENRMVNFWRAYKKSRVGRVGNTINPLNLMFRADEAQNNFFRRTLFYSKAKKAAYRRMGHSWKSIDRATTRLMDRVLARPPHQQAHLIARHGRDFEEVAKHVNNFLGDYLRFTPAERFMLQRNVMFYGYMRFSLRFAFYTMPVAHPIMANIMGNIGRLGADEIKNLMGVPDDYQLPTSILSQTYFGSRDDAKRNELRSLPLGRFNPFLNALTQLDGLQQAAGVVSPFYQIIADQAFEESSFTGRDWRIGGRPTPSESDRPRNYFGSTMNLLNPLAYDVPGHEGKPRNRIAENAILNLAYPYRVATQTGIPGVTGPLEPNQSDDALLWRPEPMAYADKGAAKGVKQSRTEFTKEPVGKRLAGALLPVFPKRTAAPAVVARELEREDAIRTRNARKPGARKKRRRKQRAVTRSYSTGGGTSPYGSRRSHSRYR